MAGDWVTNPVALIPATPGTTAIFWNPDEGEEHRLPVVAWALVEELLSTWGPGDNEVVLLRPDKDAVPDRRVEPVVVFGGGIEIGFAVGKLTLHYFDIGGYRYDEAPVP